MNREAVEESGKLSEILFWMRSGAAGNTSNYHIADRWVLKTSNVVFTSSCGKQMLRVNGPLKVADLTGPGRFNFFHLHAVSEKIWTNKRLALIHVGLASHGICWIRHYLTPLLKFNVISLPRMSSRKRVFLSDRHVPLLADELVRGSERGLELLGRASHHPPRGTVSRALRLRTQPLRHRRLHNDHSECSQYYPQM